MAFQISPGINISEIDLTTRVPSLPSSIGGIAGAFVWGPVNEIRTISSEVQLVDTFGKPNNDTAETFFTAANFLGYSGNLKVVRVVGASGLNATTGATGILVENETDYITNHSSGTSGTAWIAKYPGELGNSLMVSICDAAKFPIWAYRNAFDSAPGTSTFAAKINPNANDELHVVVIDAGGKFSGTKGTILEKFAFVSKASDAKTETGETNYYKEVINRKSKYIWWGNHHAGATGLGTAWGNPVPGATGFAHFGATGPMYDFMAWGTDHNTLTSANEISGYDMFKVDNVDVNLIMAGNAAQETIEHLIDNIGESRKDVVIFFSPEKENVVDNAGQEATDIVEYRNEFNSSSYAVMDGNWKYQFDKYNDTFRWIPCNGDVAGLCARTDLTNDPWWSPAGLNRGSIKNVIKLAWNPSKADRDTIYKAGVNSIVSFKGQGTLLYGDKTLYSKPSTFDRINVRRLFIVLEKAIATAAQYSLFEFNDAFTRSRFVALVEPYLREVKGRRGIYDFEVVCDETNNTPTVIDNNEFVGDIYVKPTKSINYIQLNFVAVPTGIAFNEIVGQF